MKKDMFISPTQRSIAYFTAFAVGAALFETVRNFIPRGFILPALAFIGTFVVIGALFIQNRNLSSRIASGVTMLILSFSSIHIGSGIPVAYDLLFILAITWLGARPVFHRQQKTTVRTVALNASVVFVAITIIIAHAFIANWLMRLALANVHYCL